MIRAIATVLALLALPALAGEQTPTWQEFPSTNKPRKHVLVEFTDSTLHPSIAQVVEGGTVSWVNYSTLFSGTIVFPKTMASAFTCSALGPDFMKTGRGLESIPIRSELEDLELPCPLKPGEYEYELWLFSTNRVDAGSIGDPQVRMQGKIIVK